MLGRSRDGEQVPTVKRAKRASVWSTVNQQEIIAISSDSDSDGSEPIVEYRDYRSTKSISTKTASGLRPEIFPTTKPGSSSKISTHSTPRTLQPQLPSRSPSKTNDPLPRSSSNNSPKKSGQKRPLSKKAQADHLAAYALDLYNSLNTVVFGNKLPPLPDPSARTAGVAGEHGVRHCSIVWSKTLRTTAGRAQISRFDGNPRALSYWINNSQTN